jgi:hypothetical protein
MRLRHPLQTLTLAAALAACGDGDAAEHAGPPAAASGPVYTSEVESVSRWIRGGGEAGDSAGLEAVRNPQGEGVLVYSRGADTGAGGERAAWAVVDSQVVPLNRAARRATPDLPEQEDDATRERIGIRRSGGEADLRGVLPPEEPAPKRQGPPPAAEPEPAPREAPSARAAGEPRDTVRVPVEPSPRPPVPLPVPAETPPAASPPQDTLHLPLPSRPLPDTIRLPGPAVEPAGTAPAG